MRLEDTLTPERKALFDRIVATATEPLYIVGGVVRDLLLGLPALDLDLVVVGDAIALANQVAANTQIAVLAHRQFGTAKLTLPNGESIDLVTARRETYPAPSALPVVSSGTIEDDIKRRDFTINALALSVPEGQLLDQVNGLADLQKGLVRTLYPKSFYDDATRMLRAVRYEQRFDFKIEPGTLKQLHFFRNQINRLSGDRIRHEMQRNLEEQQPEKILLRLAKLKLLQTIEPALNADQWLAEAYRRARAERLDRSIPLPVIYWGLLVYRNSPQDLERIIERLRLDAKLSAILREVIALRQRVEALREPDLSRSRIYRTLEGTSPAARTILAIAEPSLAPQIALYHHELATIAPKTGGKELRARGVPPGPGYKRIIEALRDAWLDRQIATREEEEVLLAQLLEEEERR